jgi:leader peptidase (prepilin peptidase) / N-methyltransferase
MFDIQIEFILRLFFLIIGACMGSFVTMASHRLPKKDGIFFKRSYCPYCNQTLKIFSLIPIFSWIFQKGHCSFCKKSIGIKYLITEIVTALLFLFIYLKFSISWNTLIVSCLTILLMIITIVDLETSIIPDSLQILVAIIAFTYIIYNKINISERLISSIVYFSTIYAVSWLLAKVKKQEVIGGGDIKLITIAGLFLGLQNFPNFLFLSGFIGVILSLIWTKSKRQKLFPFGPALATSLFLCLYFYN